MSKIDEVRAIAEPIVTARGFGIYDLDQHGPVLRLTVTGGADTGAPGIDDLGAITRELSRALDAADPIDSRYTLEVSSPGLERRLRTPVHFVGAVGEVVTVKVRVRGEPTERVRGVLAAADDDGIEVTVDPDDAGGVAEARRLTYDVIDSARTVFDWDMVAERAADRGDDGDDGDDEDGANRTRRSTR
jgi:ribosome maturation factor RimP